MHDDQQADCTSNGKTCLRAAVRKVPEVPQDCVVATRRHNPALLPASLSDPGEFALSQRRSQQQGLVFRFQSQQSGGGCSGPHAAFEAICLFATFVLCVEAYI